MSGKYFGVIKQATNFFIWFDTSINQENQLQSFPLCFMALGVGYIFRQTVFTRRIWFDNSTFFLLIHMVSNKNSSGECYPPVAACNQTSQRALWDDGESG